MTSPPPPASSKSPPPSDASSSPPPDASSPPPHALSPPLPPVTSSPKPLPPSPSSPRAPDAQALPPPNTAPPSSSPPHTRAMLVAATNQQLLDMIRPLARELHARGALDRRSPPEAPRAQPTAVHYFPESAFPQPPSASPPSIPNQRHRSARRQLAHAPASAAAMVVSQSASTSDRPHSSFSSLFNTFAQSQPAPGAAPAHGAGDDAGAGAGASSGADSGAGALGIGASAGAGAGATSAPFGASRISDGTSTSITAPLKSSTQSLFSLFNADGTSAIPYSLTVKNVPHSSRPEKYVAINMKEQLHNRSLEELRFEDYKQGKAPRPFATSPNSIIRPRNTSDASNTSCFSKKVSFRDPLVSTSGPQSETLSSFGSASNQISKTGCSRCNDYPFCSHSSNASSFPLPLPPHFNSTSAPPFHSPADHLFGSNNGHNMFSNLFYNWYGNQHAGTAATSTKPGENLFSMPSVAPPSANETSFLGGSAPWQSGAAPTPQFRPNTGDNDAGGLRSRQGMNFSPLTTFSRTSSRRQTFFSAPGEDHGPVLTEICVSETFYVPPGCRL